MPPVGVAVAEPLVPPKQPTSVPEPATDKAAGWSTVAVAVAVQSFASVTVTLYTAAGSPVMVDVVAPLLHKYVYGAVPPDALAVAVPLFPPKQLTSVLEVFATSTGGWVMVVELVLVQLFRSVTVTV